MLNGYPKSFIKKEKKKMENNHNSNADKTEGIPTLSLPYENRYAEKIKHIAKIWH